MHRGYVRLWRKAFDNGLHRNHKAWALFTWIICHVTHKEIDYMAGNKKIRLKAGQIVTGRKRLAEALGMSERNIRTGLLLLVNIGFLTIKATNKYSILTVVNWEIYQSDKYKATIKATSNRPASDQQVTTKQKQENKKTKIERGATLPPESIEFTKRHHELATQFGVTLSDQYERYHDWAHSKNEKRSDHNRAFNNWLKGCMRYDKGAAQVWKDPLPLVKNGEYINE